MALMLQRLGRHSSRYGGRYAAAAQRRAGGTAAGPGDTRDPFAIRVSRQAFTRFPVPATGTSSLMPRAHVLSTLLSTNHVQIPMAALQELAHGFARINTVSAPVGPAMEAWRAQALERFGGNLNDMTRVGRMLGRTAENRSLAHALLKVAGEEGHWDALHYYAILLGAGAIRQEGGRAQGTRWVEQLAYAGHANSALALADAGMHRRTPEGVQSAKRWARRAGEASNDAAVVFRVAEVLRRAGEHAEAALWYERAGQAGVAEAHFALGGMWRDGLLASSEGDDGAQRAFACFERAALGGVAEAQFNVGVCYMQGAGVAASARLAAEYWAMAAAQRFPAAALNLGMLCAAGASGFDRDVERARGMLGLAVDCAGGEGVVAERARDALRALDARRPGGVWGAWRRVADGVRRLGAWRR
ncbi:hypothetical protein GGI15_003345 [Coemansia interrupta]|uniref:Sel1 repeat family protein n=1 Tax=Coemansia interrupta TaxID=1126814 RepID=A0A9W8HFM5_9FUNG|nr:hypothetical protein GGI15_003345 [Coemansia interrupta]